MVFFQGLDSVSCVLCDVSEVVENEPVVVGGDYPCEYVFVAVMGPQRSLVTCLLPLITVFAFEKCENLSICCFWESFTDFAEFVNVVVLQSFSYYDRGITISTPS